MEEVARIIGQIRARWPEVRIVLRADSGFAREALMAWCEANRVDYVRITGVLLTSPNYVVGKFNVRPCQMYFKHTLIGRMISILVGGGIGAANFIQTIVTNIIVDDVLGHERDFRVRVAIVHSHGWGNIDQIIEAICQDGRRTIKGWSELVFQKDIAPA